MRIASFDTLRTPAIFAVICIHTLPFSGEGFRDIKTFALVLNQLTRFAVPFFFVTAGYFFARKLISGADPWATLWTYCKRLSFALMAWVVIYNIATMIMTTLGHDPGDTLWEALGATIWQTVGHPVAFGHQLVRFHLWFLIFLMISLAIVTVSVRYRMDRYLLPAAAVIYGIGLLAGPYATLVGLRPEQAIRNGPLFSTLFVVLGWWYARRESPGLLPAVGLLIGGALLHVAEGQWLSRQYELNVWTVHYVAGTVPFGLGAFLLALSLPRLGEGTILPRLGICALGVYLSHVLFVDGLWKLLHGQPNPVWQVGFPVVVYLASLGLTVALCRFTFTKRLVSW